VKTFNLTVDNDDNVTCLAEYRKDGMFVPKELEKGVSGVTFPIATNMEIPW
jgi:hypothetical protein